MAGLPPYPASRLDYYLPPELVAQHPPARRRDSRLLHVEAGSNTVTDREFAGLPGLLPPGCLIVMNDSRVIPARIYGSRHSGGRVELLYHSSEGEGRYRVLLRSHASLPAGEEIRLPQGWMARLLEPKQLDGSLVEIHKGNGGPAETADVHDYLDRHGIMPLPPYIKRDASGGSKPEAAADQQRYQTVFARQAGSVAAPTAGLHFDEDMLSQLSDAGHEIGFVTLHVGIGTFAPLRVNDLSEHGMHSEDFSVGAGLLDAYSYALDSGRPVLAVGTTSLRVLHTLVEEDLLTTEGGYSGSTRAFIYPGRPTRAADLLLTNFHLPRSTLLALVYSFGGEDLLQDAYRHAIAQQYRFFSYGDCMLIDRRRATP